MTWVVSKIIGDGISTETAYRTAAQQYGLAILNADHIPVDPKTGKPTSDFALIQINDGDENTLKNELGCFVLPKQIDVQTKQQLPQKLIDQGCSVDISTVIIGDDLIAVVRAKVVTDYMSKK